MRVVAGGKDDYLKDEADDGGDEQAEGVVAQKDHVESDPVRGGEREEAD
jgi:hypothetical protein